MFWPRLSGSSVCKFSASAVRPSLRFCFVRRCVRARAPCTTSAAAGTNIVPESEEHALYLGPQHHTCVAVPAIIFLKSQEAAACVCVCFTHAFSHVSDERCTRPPKAQPGLTWPPGDPDLTGEKLDKDLANRGQPDGRWGQILPPGARESRKTTNWAMFPL